MENPCECGIEPPGSINHGVIIIIIIIIIISISIITINDVILQTGKQKQQIMLQTACDEKKIMLF